MNNISEELSPYRSGSNAATRVFQSLEVTAEGTYRLLWTANEEIIFKQSEMALKNKDRIQDLVDHAKDPTAAQAEVNRIRGM